MTDGRDGMAAARTDLVLSDTSSNDGERYRSFAAAGPSCDLIFWHHAPLLSTVRRDRPGAGPMAMTAHNYQPDPVTMVAFHRAIDEHADSLKGYAARLLGDPMAAEDVAQDSFLALYRHLNQVPAAAFRPWLFRVARNLCLDQLRRRKFKLSLFRDLQKNEDQPFTPPDAGTARPDQIAETREANAAIEAAIEELPTKFREAFLLCEVEGMSYEDAAAVMGCPVKTVSTRLFRARQRFKSMVSRLINV
jgi:RNA polymerase sigma-70 factor (ECF subfamily)